jgi:hypothetical protein
VFEINIGLVENPKLVKIGKSTSHDERRSTKILFKEYKDVFAWSCDDIKAYNDDIIQQPISL